MVVRRDQPLFSFHVTIRSMLFIPADRAAVSEFRFCWQYEVRPCCETDDRCHGKLASVLVVAERAVVEDTVHFLVVLYRRVAEVDLGFVDAFREFRGVLIQVVFRVVEFAVFLDAFGGTMSAMDMSSFFRRCHALGCGRHS
jgi:hypothetical protein